MPAEFDAYAQTYADKLKDPLRESFAASGDFFAKRKLRLIREFFRRRSIDTPTVHWVDLGCGQGDLIRMGQSHFASVAGCDPSGGMVEHCEGLDVRRQKSAGQVPFADNSFDLATAVCVYHHVEIGMRADLTREGLRVLKPGGIFCIIEHNPFNPITQIIVRRSPIDSQAHLLTAGNAARVMRCAGAQVMETRYFLYFPERIYRMFGRAEDFLAGFSMGGQYALFARKA